MRLELSNASISTITATSSSSVSNLISVVQQALSDTEWEGLQVAHSAYLKNPGKFQRQNLQKNLTAVIQKLHMDYQHISKLKAQAEKRLSQFYPANISGWIFRGLQRFFDSDDASLVTRYQQIAQNRRESLTELRQYRDSLAVLEVESLGIAWQQDTPTPTPTPTPTSNDTATVSQNILPVIGGIIGGGFGFLLLFAAVCIYLNREQRPEEDQITPVDETKITIVNLELDQINEEKQPVSIHLYPKREVTPVHFFPTPYIPDNGDAKTSTKPGIVKEQQSTLEYS